MRSSNLIDKSSRPMPTGARAILPIVAALTIAVALPGCAIFPKSSNPAADQKITADVETGFAQSAALQAPNQLTVQTINGVVYLDGLVSSGLQRGDAVSVANQVQGVDKVVNTIAVVR